MTAIMESEVQGRASVESALNTTAKVENRFVVLHTGLGRFRRGDVISGSELGDGQNILRLLGLKAIRGALGGESFQNHVEIKDDDLPNLSYQQKLAEKDQEILHLRERVNSVHDDNMRSSPHQLATLQADFNNANLLLREKDRAIVDAQTRYGTLHAQVIELERTCANLRQENLALSNKLKFMEQASAQPQVDDIRSRISAATGTPPADPETPADKGGKRK